MHKKDQDWHFRHYHWGPIHHIRPFPPSNSGISWLPHILVLPSTHALICPNTAKHFYQILTMDLSTTKAVSAHTGMTKLRGSTSNSVKQQMLVTDVQMTGHHFGVECKQAPVPLSRWGWPCLLHGNSETHQSECSTRAPRIQPFTSISNESKFRLCSGTTWKKRSWSMFL